MGAVYKALHLRLDKVVALKLQPARRMADPHAASRFDREMKAVGKLDHPHIVRATDAGEVAGMRYLVMEFVDGLDLGRISRHAGPLRVADACEIVRQAAQGLQHVYEAGLVHRDIKPSNLILTRAGQVKVLDLGLALLRDAAADELTDSNQVLGTLDYMAPEQCTGSHVVDIRADLYSLGATLYKLLAGLAPFAESTSPAEKIQALINAPVEPILSVRSDVPDALAAILDRLLAKDPQARFAQPAELAAALAPLAQGHDLPALLETCRQRLVAAGEDIRGEVPTPESLGLACSTASCAVPIARPPRRRGWLAAAILVLLLAGVAWGAMRMAGVEVSALLGLAGDGPGDRSPAELAGELFALDVTGEGGVNMALAADVGLLLTGGGNEQELALWDLRSRKKLKVLGRHQQPVRSVAITPDGRRALSASWSEPIRYWDVETGQVLHEFESHDGVEQAWVGGVAFSPNGKLMASVGTDARLKVWNLETKEKVHDFECQIIPTTWARGVAFSPNGRMIATAGNDLLARVWDTDSGDELARLGPHQQPIGKVVFSPQGDQLLTAGYDHQIFLWDIEPRRRAQFFVKHEATVTGIAFTPDGRHVLSSSNDSSARLWNVASGESIYSFHGHGRPVHGILCTPDGRYAITSGGDAKVRVWRLPLEVPADVPDYLSPQ
jgi:hypothetical protein